MRSRIEQGLAEFVAKSAPPRGLLKAALAGPETAAPSIQLPPGFSGPDYAAMLLHLAAEVEHALLVEYLYAAYSLGGPQVPLVHRKKVQEWQTILLGIAKEEMGHFVTVQNVLRLIGAPLNLERDDFPWDAPFAPFAFSLEKLTPASLARYVYVESPDPWPDDAEPYRAAIEALAKAGQSRSVNRVGILYERIIALLGDTRLIPDSVFQASTMPYQASWDEWGRGYRDGARGAAGADARTPDLIIQTCYSRASAIAALTAVAEQGEDPGIDPALDEASHFRRFFAIWKEFPTEGSWSPVRDLATNPTTVDGVEGAAYIADPQTRLWATLINLRYRMMLTYLGHSFRLSGSATGPAAEARGLVLNGIFGEMYNLRVVSHLLVGMPLGDDSGRFAGPSFEMPYSLDLPDGEGDTWQLHVALIDASLRLVAELEPGASAAERDYLASLAALDATKRAAMADVVKNAYARPTHLGGWS